MTQDSEAAGGRGGAPAYYEEVTLTDLVVTIVRHWRAAAAVFVVVMLAAAALTVTAAPAADAPRESDPPVYRATATLLVLSEADTVLTVMNSVAFAEDVASNIEVAGAEPSGQFLADQVTVSGEYLVTVTARWDDSGDAIEIADAYVSTLEEWRPYFEGITWAKNWQRYYESSGRDTEQASNALAALISGTEYYKPLDGAMTTVEASEAPTPPAGPNVKLNLALGAVLGAMLALMTPFVLEAGANVRRELRARRER